MKKKKRKSHAAERAAQKSVQKPVHKPPRKPVQKSDQKPAQKSHILGEIIALLACVPFFLMGVAFIHIGITEISYTKSCTSETAGVINDVSRTHTYKDGRHSRKYQYKATYSYELDGREHTDYFTTAKWVYEGKKSGSAMTLMIRRISMSKGMKMQEMYLY